MEVYRVSLDLIKRFNGIVPWVLIGFKLDLLFFSWEFEYSQAGISWYSLVV